MMGRPSNLRHAVSVIAFIDWNTQLRLTKRDCVADPERVAEAAFKETARRVASCLTTINSEIRFKVTLRLYHGWHQGYEPSVNKKAVQKVIARTDYVALSHKQNVVFVPEVEYGDRLLVAQETRLHSKLGIHLPNTLRKRSNTDFEEKMVDTALSADVVAAAYSVNSSWILVVSEDDDIIPPLFVAESALFGYNSKVKLLRKRDCMQMQHLNDILVKG